ncbi:MAG: prephenate dehydrogenase/arogenate dehydrogenase family protein [Candidatus Margulisiibacteriota bacterium]
MKKIAVIGLGLIGASIALGLKNSSKASEFRIVGIPRREETINDALKMGAIDEGVTDHIKGASDADIVFICTPINLIPQIIKEISPSLKKGAIVTDVGSSKQMIVSEAEKAMPKGTFFVGGHPMAGKETFKLESAEANLFEGKKWILTPTSRTSKKAIEALKEVVRVLGGEVLEMDPKTHDLVVAGISHMPLAVAASLVNAVGGEEQKEIMAKCASTGFRDTTRIASGDPILGVDMFTTNQKAILKMIGSFKRSLSNLEKLIKEGNSEKIREELEKAKKFRDSIYSLR